MNNQQLKQSSNVESPTTPNAAAPHSRDLRIKNVVAVHSSDSSSLTVKTSGGNVESHPSSGSCSVDANNAAPISGSVNRIAGGESEKSSLSSASYYSDSVDISNEGSTTTPTPTTGNSFRSLNKPHKGNDVRWEAIQQVKTKDGSGCELGLGHFRLLKKLGFGDIGSVYLAELRGSGGSGSGCLFAMKVMDKGMLAGRKKLTRAQTERDILGLLDHPFLPTLYSHFETEKFSCLLMEFCNGGDLHILRQRQPGKHFSEQAARFYASEVLLALEYLHMMGVVYRDLKPENVLVREDGHIMLSDFDLSLRCCVNPTLLKSTTKPSCAGTSSYCIEPSCLQPGTSCVQPPSCLQPSCFIKPRRFFNTKHKNSFKSSNHHGSTESKPEKTTNSYSIRPDSLPVVVVEPTTARSMSFVGTHEYLSPEIIRGDGHGSAVDWWTFGVFLYELLHGKTPFKGNGNRETLLNVVSQPLKFQEVGGGTGTVSFAAKDLIRGLLVKDPQKRLGYKRGAIEIKQHPFFAEVNWALIRGTVPPEIPKKVDLGVFNNVKSGEEVSDQSGCGSKQGGGGSDLSDRGSGSPYLDFEFF